MPETQGKVRFLTMQELLEKAAEGEKARCVSSPWRINRVDGENLEHPASGYWIPLDEIKTRDDVLQWIMHINQKNWADHHTMADLVWWLSRLFSRLIR